MTFGRSATPKFVITSCKHCERPITPVSVQGTRAKQWQHLPVGWPNFQAGAETYLYCGMTSKRSTTKAEP